jgi:hypothetical protein
MTEGSDTELFQVLVCQIAEDREIDIVVSKALGVLGQSEFFEPISNLLHRRLYRRLSEPKAYHCSPHRCRSPSLKSGHFGQAVALMATGADPGCLIGRRLRCGADVAVPLPLSRCRHVVRQHRVPALSTRYCDRLARSDGLVLPGVTQ